MKIAYYLEALTIICDCITDTPFLVIQLLSESWAESRFKLGIFCFSTFMLVRCWARFLAAMYIFFRYVTKRRKTKSKLVKRVYGSVVTYRKHVKSKVVPDLPLPQHRQQHCQHHDHRHHQQTHVPSLESPILFC